MDIKEVFSDQFVAAVHQVVDSTCENGKSITRAEVAEKIGLVGQANLIGMVLGMPLFEAFESRLGIGIIRVGEARAVEKPVISENFIKVLSEALHKHIPEETAISLKRTQVARAMNAIDSTIFPDSDTENEISRALADWQVPGFGIRKGPNGGVGRMKAEEFNARRVARAEKLNLPVPESVVDSSVLLVSSEGSEEAIPEGTPEPEAPVVEPKKKGKKNKKTTEVQV